MQDELKTKIATFREQLAEMESYLQIAAKRTALEQLESAAADPDFWSDQARAKANIDESLAGKLLSAPY